MVGTDRAKTKRSRVLAVIRPTLWVAVAAAALVTALAGGAMALTGQSRRAAGASPPWAAINLPAHRIVGPAILVGPAPIVESTRRASVQRAPAITGQPDSNFALAGHTVSFTATASGRPAPSIQWQRSANRGDTWRNIRGAHEVTYTLTARASQDGYSFRAVFRNSGGQVASRVATLRIVRRSSERAPRITRQPAGESAASGATVTFTAAASGRPTPTVHWERLTTSGASWTAVSGASSTSYSFTAQSSENGDRYRAVFTNSAGRAATHVATLNVTARRTGKPAITAQPSNQTVLTGGTARFTAAASGRPTPSVQWEVSANRGGSWSKIAGATSRTLSVTANNQQLYEYRAVFTNSIEAVISKPATLTIAQAAYNWSGYAAPGTGFRSVSASWVVSRINCSGSPQQTFSAQWIGIDGYSSNSVEQDGTEADCIGRSPYYGAWYEMFGDNSVNGGAEVSLSSSRYPVYPGDSMTASVSVSGTTWTLDIFDSTQGWSFSQPISWAGGQQSSAEWIVERPAVSNPNSGNPNPTLAALSDFGVSGFTHASASNGSASGPISSFSFDPIEMVNSNANPLAVPGPLNLAGTTFYDIWTGSS